MLATTLCRDSDPADSSVNGHFRSFRTTHSSHEVRDSERPEIVRDILGHVNTDVTQNVYGASWCEESVDAVPPVPELCQNPTRCRSRAETDGHLLHGACDRNRAARLFVADVGIDQRVHARI